MRAYVVFSLRAFLASKLCQVMQGDWIKRHMNPYQVMKVSLKPVNFIVEYLKVECIGIVLEAEDGATEIRKFEQPRERWHKERHKFAYLTMKNNSFARFAQAIFISVHFADVIVLLTKWNDLFCSCGDEVSIRGQMLILSSYLWRASVVRI